MRIQIKRGKKENLPNGKIGEPLFVTDEGAEELYIGRGEGKAPLKIANSKDVEMVKNDKVDRDDIVDNLESDDGTKVLSAKQGKELKTQIDNNKSELEAKINSNKEEVDSQIKEKANKVDLEIEKRRIDNLTTLPEGSTTGDAELIDARIGADGNTYDNLGNAVRTQLTNLNTRIDNLASQEIKVVFKERQITLTANQTSDKLIDDVVVGRKYIVLIKNGTAKVSLALDKDHYGNGRSWFSNSHNGYAINETRGS